MAIILNGKILQEKIKGELKSLVASLGEGNVPELSIIQVGSNESSSLYIRRKINFGENIGVPVTLHHLDENVSEEKVPALISELNNNDRVGGIIVQLPLPFGLDKDKILGMIVAEKDVDGLMEGKKKGMVPATTRGILSMLDFYNIPLKEKKVLVIGRSNLVGKPTALACESRGAIVSVAHSKTSPTEFLELCHQADIIISAAGVPNLISEKHVKASHVIVDVGISRFDGKIVGDVDFEKVSKIVYAISPVPGGVGPLTVASLFENLLSPFSVR